jgi:hypothetical protein
MFLETCTPFDSCSSGIILDLRADCNRQQNTTGKHINLIEEKHFAKVSEKFPLSFISPEK